MSVEEIKSKLNNNLADGLVIYMTFCGEIIKILQERVFENAAALEDRLNGIRENFVEGIKNLSPVVILILNTAAVKTCIGAEKLIQPSEESSLNGYIGIAGVCTELQKLSFELNKRQAPLVREITKIDFGDFSVDEYLSEKMINPKFEYKP